MLVDLLERLTTHLVHAPHSTLSVGDRWREALDEHARLLDAIRDHDEPTARAVAAEHITTARQIRLQLLRNAAAQAATVSWTRSRLVRVDNLLHLCCWAPARFVNLA